MNNAKRKELIRLLRKAADCLVMAADYLETETNGEDSVVTVNKEEIITMHMYQMGISVKPVGFNNIKRAVLLCIDDTEMLNSLDNKLYPKVAEFYNTMPSTVEDSIRYSIKEMWRKGSVEEQYRIFGYSRQENSKAPSIKKFLLTFINYIRINHMV